jgi:hypothetical protein
MMKGRVVIAQAGLKVFTLCERSLTRMVLSIGSIATEAPDPRLGRRGRIS